MYCTTETYAFCPTGTRAVQGYRGPLEAHDCRTLAAPMDALTWALAPLRPSTTRPFGMYPSHMGHGVASIQL